MVPVYTASALKGCATVEKCGVVSQLMTLDMLVGGMKTIVDMRRWEDRCYWSFKCSNGSIHSQKHAYNCYCTFRGMKCTTL